jgi:hypothetical protein
MPARRFNSAQHMNYAEAVAEALAEEHGTCTAKPLPK